MKRRKLSDQSLLEKERQRSRKLTVESRKKVHSFKRQEGSTKSGVTNEEISDPRQGPPENCVIGVGTGQVDGSNAGFVREQWDRVAWKQTILTHCAGIAGNQIRNIRRFKDMKSFRQKIQLEAQKPLILGTRTRTKGRQGQSRVKSRVKILEVKKPEEKEL